MYTIQLPRRSWFRQTPHRPQRSQKSVDGKARMGLQMNQRRSEKRRSKRRQRMNERRGSQQKMSGKRKSLQEKSEKGKSQQRKGRPRKCLKPPHLMDKAPPMEHNMLSLIRRGVYRPSWLVKGPNSHAPLLEPLNKFILACHIPLLFKLFYSADVYRDYMPKRRTRIKIARRMSREKQQQALFLAFF